MADAKPERTPRGSIARQFDVMTLALFVIALCVAACVALAVGPDEALDRIGCGQNGAVGAFLSRPLPCR